MTSEVAERFSRYVEADPNGGCWLWSGTMTQGGYGQLHVDRKRVAVHRLSYELHVGPIPEGEGYHGVCVCHHCDVRLCVNPAHLFLGTQWDNCRDRDRKGRGNLAKLTPEDVAEIKASAETNVALAERYGVDQANIGLIKRGVIWSYITPAGRTSLERSASNG